MRYTKRSKFDDVLDTEWKESAKGNYWRKSNGTVLVVGGSYEKGYWVRVGDNFLPEWESSLEAAKMAAEYGAK